MSSPDLVRPSRDGDQFHYYWASRWCLQLLPGTTDLVAVTIEGPSAAEASDDIDLGDEVIDVGLYFGEESREDARSIRYVQLKHSTREALKPWTASGLRKTIAGFAKRYSELCNQFDFDDVAARFRFEFTTNRPINPNVVQAIADLRSGVGSRHQKLKEQLIGYTDIDASSASKFFALFHVEGDEPDLWKQRNMLAQEAGSYLAEADYDAPIQLKELVTRKATTEFESDPSIRRHDVLRALKTSEEELHPACNRIPSPSQTLQREQEAQVLTKLLAAQGPLIIHADGGVGKSVLAARLASSMPLGSEAVLYDCFGDGLYRSELHRRHWHRDALVQIANELAARGLCHPLVPGHHVEAKSYVRAFVGRLAQAVQLLRARDPNARICLIIDAADNAEMAAEERGETGSFVRDLVRTPLPPGVCLALTCRTHRRSSLRAGPDAVEVELLPFSRAESDAHLRGSYPEATETQVAEFAFLSSSNPRVQSLALSRKLPLQEMLTQLGPNPTTVGRAIDDLLESTIAGLHDRAGPSEKPQVDLICQALGLLRPLVPIPVVARLAGTSEATVRSFVLDFGRPLLMRGDRVHFVDEPAETWFRERFKPDATALAEFLDRLRPLASQSSYAAAALPQFLLLSNKLDELVQLALTGEHLPSTNSLEKRDVELQRLTFALKACLEGGKHIAAAKLALKAAGESAGEERQNRLIHQNTDLAATLMAADRISEIVSRRTFRSGWMGSHHAYDAGLLSGRAELHAEAASRLRMARDWLEAWARGPQEERELESVTHADIAELAIGTLRLEGPTAAVRLLRIWRPRRVGFEAGRHTVRRLICLGQYDQVSGLFAAATPDLWLLLAVATEVRAVGHTVPTEPLAHLLRILCDPRITLMESTDPRECWEILNAVRSAVELGLRVLAPRPSEWADLLRRYLPALPPRDIARWYGDRGSLLRAYALEAALRGQTITLKDVTPPALRPPGSASSQEAGILRSDVAGLVPSYALSAEIVCGRRPADLPVALEAALTATTSAAAQSHRAEKHELWAHAVLLWFQILRDAVADRPPATPSEQGGYETWLSHHSESIGLDSMTKLCGLAAQVPGFDVFALNLASHIFTALDASREDAESRVESYVDLARAIVRVSSEEATVYFHRAIEIASRIGDENLDRWRALLHLASAAAEADKPRAQTGYRLSRATELTYEYVARDKHFDWDGTVDAITDLCPASALAIASRWRDRGFGDSGRILPIVIEGLVTSGRLSPIATAVLSGFCGRWDRVANLKQTLEAENDPVARSRSAQVAYRYLRVRSAPSETWTELSEIAKTYELDFADLSRIRLAENMRTLRETRTPTRESPSAAFERDPSNWKTIFDGIDVDDAGAIRSAYLSLPKYDPRFTRECFFGEALARVAAGRKPEFVRSAASWTDFGVFEVRDLVAAVGSPLPKQLSLRAAVRDAVLAACERQPDHVHRHGWGSIFPFEQLYSEGVVSDQDVVAATLAGYANHVDALDATKLFQILDPLASCLSPQEADEALNFGLDLLENVLRPGDGDGAWSPELQPPESVISALAGYVWAGLGSARVAERWQLAHVVRAAVELDWTEFLEALLRIAASGSAGAFADQGLEFYEWHARQWLLIGLARGARDNPRALRNTVSFLQSSRRDEHVLIREYADQALRAWLAAGDVPLEHQAELDAVNCPLRPAEAYSDDEAEAETPDATESEQDDHEYYGGIDFGPYWFEPLGRVFGLSQGAIARRVKRAVREQLSWAGGHNWSDDARHARKIFNEGATWHSHGSLPKEDDLSAYHGYHAMMFVAAALLKTRAVRSSDGGTQDAFREWLARHLLTRTDGMWLADRRDPRLVADPPCPEGYRDELWCWSPTAQSLDETLVADDGAWVLWGGWSSSKGGYDETVVVRSALVSRPGAEALVAALQTAPDLNEFGLPPAGAERDLELGPLRLRGWVLDEDTSGGLDKSDPWAADLRYPGPVPADSIVRALNLTRSADGRAWRDGDRNLLRSEIWTEVRHHGSGEETNSGERLSVGIGFLRSLLQAHPDESLILSVEVTRRLERQDGKNSGWSFHRHPYIRYYLLGVDGVAHALKSST